MTHDQPGNLRTSLCHKLWTEVNIVAQVVDAELEAFKRKCGSVSAQARKCDRLGCLSEAENGDAWHDEDGLRLRLLRPADQAYAELRHHQCLLDRGQIQRGQ